MRFTLKRAECELVGEILGDGPTVVLLHAGGEHRHVWRHIIKTLEPAGYRAVTLDLRGHGDSRAQSSPTFDEYVGDARLLVHWLDCDAVLVGASLGGLLALQCAADAAQAGRVPSIAGLVLVDVVPDPNPERARAGLANILPLHSPQWSLVDEILGRADELRAAARAVAQPTLLVRASESFSMRAEDTRRLRALVPQLEEVVIEECGHLVAQERPHELSAALLAFLARDEVRARLGCVPSTRLS